MKRLVVVLSSLLVLPAFAEVAPSNYDAEMMLYDAELDDEAQGAVATDEVVEESTAPVAKSAPKSTSRTSARVAVSGRSVQNTARQPRTPVTRTNIATSSRSVATRGATATPVRTTSGQTTARRTSGVGSVSTSGRGASAQRAGNKARVSVTSSSLYNPNAVVQSRGSATRASSVVTRGASMRAATVTKAASAPTADEAAETTNDMNTLKSLTEYCQSQYLSCMDNYCNVLDDNQGRCTCSKNLQNYQKTETALANATEALQDVARSIQYIGLSTDQITTLFTETEAELTMKDSKDNSAIRSSLDKVKRMIVDVKSGGASGTSESSAMSFDLSGLLNFDMDDTGFDFMSFMNTTNSGNTDSISNQRGESLYKTAAARCKASVLSSCTAQGVDAAVVTNYYDLEIDKSCLAYERALTESNKQMTQTVANAKEVLKKARLMVAQNKNSYDLRGCVSALESCMQDDYVCGNEYEGCLDPSGQYIVNGAVVVGSMPGNNTNADGSQIRSSYTHDNLFSTWLVKDSGVWKSPWRSDLDSGNGMCVDTSSTNVDDSNTSAYQQATTSSTTSNNQQQNTTASCITLHDYIEKTVSLASAQKASDGMSAYLQYKIGYHDDKNNKDFGMCMSVLNKCQAYTYDKKGKYDPENEVIKQFLQRALIQIKTTQDELLASYAEDCVSDVSSCLSSNGFEANNTGSTKSRTAINSCYAQIKTCFSVNGNIYGPVTPTVVRSWVDGTFGSRSTVTSVSDIVQLCTSITDQTECESQSPICIYNDGADSEVMNQVCQYRNSSCVAANSINTTNPSASCH